MELLAGLFLIALAVGGFALLGYILYRAATHNGRLKDE